MPEFVRLYHTITVRALQINAALTTCTLCGMLNGVELDAMKEKSVSENRKINTTLFFNILAPIILSGISFFTIPIFTRMLGPTNYGYYTVYNSYQSILLIVMSLQTHASISTTSVYYKGKDRDRCFSNGITISLLFSLAVSVIVMCLSGPISKLTDISVFMIFVMLLHTVGMFGVNWAMGRLAYDKKAKWNFLVSITVSVSATVISLIWIPLAAQGPAKYQAYVLGHAIPYILVGVPSLLIFLVKGRSFFSKQEWKFVLTFCLPLIFHALSNTILHQSDKLMVDAMIGKEAAGIYGFAVTFANILNIIYNALNTTWIPFYHDDIAKGDKTVLFKKANNYLFLFSSLVIGFIMASPEVVKIFASKDFWDSVNYIPLLSAGIYFIFLYSFPANFEFYYKRSKIIAVGTTFACLFNIGLNYVLIGLIGMTGAAIATLASYILLFIFHSIAAEFVIKEEYHYKGFKRVYIYMSIVLASCGLFYLIRDLVIVRWAIFASLAVALVVRTIKNKSIF